MGADTTGMPSSTWDYTAIEGPDGRFLLQKGKQRPLGYAVIPESTDGSVFDRLLPDFWNLPVWKDDPK